MQCCGRAGNKVPATLLGEATLTDAEAAPQATRLRIDKRHSCQRLRFDPMDAPLAP